MALNLYRGFVPTNGKRSTMPFKDKPSDHLLTLEEAQKFGEYAGILSTSTVLIDIDDYEHGYGGYKQPSDDSALNYHFQKQIVSVSSGDVVVVD